MIPNSVPDTFSLSRTIPSQFLTFSGSLLPIGSKKTNNQGKLGQLVAVSGCFKFQNGPYIGRLMPSRCHVRPIHRRTGRHGGRRGHPTSPMAFTFFSKNQARLTPASAFFSHLPLFSHIFTPTLPSTSIFPTRFNSKTFL